MLYQQKHCQLSGEGHSTGRSEGRLLEFYNSTSRDCADGATQRHTYYHSRKGKVDLYNADSAAEAEDDRDAIGLEGRATGPKSRAESHRGLVPGLET